MPLKTFFFNSKKNDYRIKIVKLEIKCKNEGVYEMTYDLYNIYDGVYENHRIHTFLICLLNNRVYGMRPASRMF